jgi:exosome complex RNA-binding protein Csl4
MADINIKVGLQGAEQVKAQMGYIQTAANTFAEKLTNKFVSTFSAVAVGAMAFDKLLESVNKNISAAKQITALSTKFHLDPKAVHSMMIAANNAGVAIRTLLQGMKQLTKYADGSMGKGGGNKDMMKQLFGFDANGKEVADLDAKIQEISKSPAKFLPEVAMALAKINNEQDKTKMGTALLGRQYQQLIPLLEQLAESEEARNNFLNNGSAMSAEQIEQAKKLGAATSDLANSWDKFAASLFPVLTFLLNGLTLLGSWVKQIGLIGDAWRNSVVQSNAKVNEKISRYEGGLRTRAESGNLTDEEKADLKKAQDGGMSQEEWIQKRLKDYGRNEWAKRRQEAGGTKTMLKGAALIAGGALLTATGVGAGAGLYMMGAGGAIALAGGIEGEMGQEAVDEEQKKQEEAYYAEIRKKKNEYGRLATAHEQAQNIEKAKKEKETRTAEALEDAKKRTYNRFGQHYVARHGMQNLLNKDEEYQGKLKKIDTDYNQDIQMSGNIAPDSNTPIGQAYNFLVNEAANKSEKEISDKMLALGLEEKDAIAGLMKITGKEYYFDRQSGEYKQGKKPKELDRVTSTKLNFRNEEIKKQQAKEKMLKARTRSERQLALAEMKANNQTSPEEEAVMGSEMNVVNAKEDIEAADLKLSGKADILNDTTLSDRDRERKLAEVRTLKQQAQDAEEDVQTKQNKLIEAQQEQKKHEDYLKTLSPAQIDKRNEELNKKTAEVNAKVSDAEAKLATAKVAATEAEKKENEAFQESQKAKIDLANAQKELERATEQLWLKERQLREEAIKDEEQLEQRMYNLKYRNMKKLGYTQQAIMEEQFMDSVSNYNRLEDEYKDVKDEITARMIEEGRDRMTDAERGQLRNAESTKGKAFDKVQEDLNKWEDYKGERVVSDLGRVGGGSAFQMAGSGPTNLLKEQVKLQTAIAYNTDPKHLEKLQQARLKQGQTVYGDRSVWGKKQKLIR